MIAPPAVCSCGEPAFADQKCSVTVENWSTSACSGAAPPGKAEGTVPGNTCFEKRGTGAYIKFLPGVFSATCSFPSPTTTRPDPTYDRLNVACGLPQVGSCSGRPDCTATPLPEAPFGRLCIHKDGDVACPSEDYAARFLAYRGVVDERSCTPCTGKARGTCGTSPKVSSSDICASGNVDAQVGACQTAGSFLNIAGMGVVSAACEAQGGAPAGQVTDKDPITFCCNR